MKVCYVSAFLDIDRENWDIWEKRSVNTYIEYFMRQVPFFKNSKEYEMFVFIDSKYYSILRARIDKDYPIYLVPINENFLEENSLLWRRLPREKKIMESDWFRTIMSHRLSYAEVSQPKYTMINNVKIDLIVHAMDLTDAEVFGWVDFGYVKMVEVLPRALVDVNKFDLKRMNFSLISQIRDDDYDIMKTLTNPREIIEGGFYFSSRDVLLKYQKLFHETHQMFHDMNIVDDDQHILIQMIKKQPELFKLYYQGKWLMSLRYFQREEKFGFNVIAQLCGGIGNQLFQIANCYAQAKRMNGNLLILQKNNYDMRRGSLPEKYKSSIYKNLKIVDSPTNSIAVIQEQKWAYYDISCEVARAKREGVKNLVIEGYYQSEKHFREYRNDIRCLFTPSEGIISFLSNQEENVFDSFPELASSHDYCFIGVRRQDYITYSQVHNPCGMTYYNKAMNLMKKERYYIASDDIEWCRKNFVGEQYKFFEIKDDLVQLLSISLFNNYIIANSSYHWWGSYLSVYNNPKIIAPNLWLDGPNVPYKHYSSVYREEMTVLERPVEIS